MSGNANYPVQTPQESLSWISFNLKALVKEVKELGAILKEMAKSPKKDDIPF